MGRLAHLYTHILVVSSLFILNRINMNKIIFLEDINSKKLKKGNYCRTLR